QLRLHFLLDGPRSAGEVEGEEALDAVFAEQKVGETAADVVHGAGDAMIPVRRRQLAQIRGARRLARALQPALPRLPRPAGQAVCASMTDAAAIVARRIGRLFGPALAAVTARA